MCVAVVVTAIFFLEDIVDDGRPLTFGICAKECLDDFLKIPSTFPPKLNIPGKIIFYTIKGLWKIEIYITILFVWISYWLCVSCMKMTMFLLTQRTSENGK